MDFLETPNFATVEQAVYVGFLGIGNKKKAGTSQAQGNADLANRFPFSDNCEAQKKIVKALLDESAQTLSSRNSSKGSSRVQLSGRLDAYDAYIPAAIAHMNNVSCLAPEVNPLPDVKSLLEQEEELAKAAGIKKTIMVAGIVVAAAIGVIIIIRKLKN